MQIHLARGELDLAANLKNLAHAQFPDDDRFQ